mmetsp:Transcript_42456/g.128834  ORF Transcript_42456/g.128834 Transcript_42456/m.128834 type:complete len:279 (-) Transcript_42456:2366-3202(-)|eukprot:CAMPEP_0113549198 /NCGR_PEP_ID=MMETSP0015_2-20120614/13305_1 /TAXON_ID=2838 /ORGANISM="Odontella" /LENGTH=278 /DNA_ID=CAMNT_0000449891 /DNA_START=153 /DNA_END=989 /DNA_ORIENTATION=+ /assembly_acc=CAM_ASM_000160
MAPPSDVADADVVIDELWRSSTDEILAIDPATENWKSQVLPLARIKKIMKSEEGILSDMEKEKSGSGGEPASASSGGQRFMIAGEAPVLLGKACELFVREVTMRAWRHTERNRRRTLQKQDVHAAVGESEVYDFLIDIVPRVTPTTGGKSYSNTEPPAPSGVPASAEAAAAAQVPPPAGAAGSDAPAAMTIADAEMRLGHLQQLHDHYQLMHRQAHVGAGPPMPPQQPVMNPYMQMPPEQAAAQWSGQVMRGQQHQSIPSASDQQQGGPVAATKEEPT